jgi:hypothetical protein
MRIKKLALTQIVLVQHDEIPLNKLLHRSYLERLATFFQFSNVEVVQTDTEQFAILCRHGIYKSESGEHIIKKLELTERKIIFQIDGSSNEANKFFASLTDFLSNLSGTTKEEKHLSPIVKAEESEITTRLEFTVESLFSPAYWLFVKSTVAERANSDIAEANIKPASLVFDVEYLIKDKALNDYGITLGRKEFTVSPKRGYPLDEQIYYSKAPVDTNTHIKLLEELERKILQTKE